MNQKELRELIEFLVEKDIAEFELERGDLKVRIRRAGEATVVQASPAVMAPGSLVTAAAPPAPMSSAAAEAAVAGPAPAAASPAAAEADLHIVKSPIVGTFYESPSPGSPPFVKIGDTVEAGSILCIVEAMKLMNEIESDVSGEIVKKLASNGQPVEYGQPLFSVRAKA